LSAQVVQRPVPGLEASSAQVGHEGQAEQVLSLLFWKVPALHWQTDPFNSQPAAVSHSLQLSLTEQLTHPVRVLQDRQVLDPVSKKLLAKHPLHTAWPGFELFSSQVVRLTILSEHLAHLAFILSVLSTKNPSSQ